MTQTATGEFKFDEQGLLPAVVQDWLDGTVLMLGYMNREAIGKTLATKSVHFWSRSRMKLWEKGIGFDVVSDGLLADAKVDGGLRIGGCRYRFTVIPECRMMPPATLRKLLDLVKTGTEVIFKGPLPTDVPGFSTQCIRKSRSWNVGSSDCPSSGTVRAPATISVPTVAYASRGPRMIGASNRS